MMRTVADMYIMRKYSCFFFLLLIFLPLSAGTLYKTRAEASYYADKFHGRRTANGETFNMYALTAAHKTLPFNTIVRVTNLTNGKYVDVRINDRGPFVKGREIDLSKGAAVKLGMIKRGTAVVSLEIITSGDAVAPKSAVTPKQAANATSNKWTPPQGTYWDIQLGAYSNKDNARRCAQKLSANGFTVSYEQSGTVTRVLIAKIPAEQLFATEQRLKKAGYTEYAVKERLSAR